MSHVRSAYLCAGEVEQGAGPTWVGISGNISSTSRTLHSLVRKIIRNKENFPSDEAATKLVYLVLRNITVKWKNPPREWHAAKAHFAIQIVD